MMNTGKKMDGINPNLKMIKFRGQKFKDEEFFAYIGFVGAWLCVVGMLMAKYMMQ